MYDKKQDSTWKEKNVIAIVDGKEILAVGDEAYAMFDRYCQCLAWNTGRWFFYFQLLGTCLCDGAL